MCKKKLKLCWRARCKMVQHHINPFGLIAFYTLHTILCFLLIVSHPGVCSELPLQTTVFSCKCLFKVYSLQSAKNFEKDICWKNILIKIKVGMGMEQKFNERYLWLRLNTLHLILHGWDWNATGPARYELFHLKGVWWK